ncbi:MAG TPA: acyltransferase, partial [Anaerolineales bacterium]
RRFFRIAPLFYLAIGLYTLVYGFGPREYAPNGIQAWQYPLTFLFLNGWHPEAINSIVPIEWSVAIEMTFYLCIPLLFAALKDLESTGLFIIGSLILQFTLAAVLTPVLMLHYPDQSRLVRSFLFLWFFSQLPVFGIGIATYHIFRATKLVKDRKLGLTLLAGAVFLFVVGLNVKTFLGLLPQHVFYAVAFLLFALALHYHPTRVLVNPFTRWVGRVSYSLYLLHFLVVELIMRALPAPWPMGKTTAFFLAFVLITGLSLPVAGLSYRFIEVPGMNFGKRLIRGLEKPAAPQTAP